MSEQKSVVSSNCGQIIVKDPQMELVNYPIPHRNVFVGYHNNYVHVFETFDEFPPNFHHSFPEFPRQTNGHEYSQFHESDIRRYNMNERLEPTRFCEFTRNTTENSRYISSIPPSHLPLIHNCQHFPPCVVFRGPYSEYGSANPNEIIHSDAIGNLQTDEFIISPSPMPLETSHSELLPAEVRAHSRFGHIRQFEVQNFSHSSVHLQYTPFCTDNETHFRYIPTAVPAENPTLCNPTQAQFGPVHSYHDANLHIIQEDSAQRKGEFENRIVNENTATHVCSTEQRMVHSSENENNNCGEKLLNTTTYDAQIFQSFENIPSFSYIDPNNVGNPAMFPNYSHTAQDILKFSQTDSAHIVEMVTDNNESENEIHEIHENKNTKEIDKDNAFVNEKSKHNSTGSKMKSIAEQKESTVTELRVTEYDKQSNSLNVKQEIIDVDYSTHSSLNSNVGKEVVAENNAINNKKMAHEQFKYAQTCHYQTSRCNQYLYQNFDNVSQENDPNVNIFLQHYRQQNPGNSSSNLQDTGRQPIDENEHYLMDRNYFSNSQTLSDLNEPHPPPPTKTSVQDSVTGYERLNTSDSWKEHQIPMMPSYMVQEEVQRFYNRGQLINNNSYSEQYLESIIQRFDRALAINGSDNRPHKCLCRGSYCCYFCFQQRIKHHQLAMLQREEILYNHSNSLNNKEHMRLLNIPIGNILLIVLLMWCFRFLL